jgi:NTE family protein
MSYYFKNLVFEGGGVKGIAYVGAMEELYKREIVQQITRVGGTSAGAINAVLAGLNFSPDETKEMLWKLDFNNFLDDSFGIIRDTKRLINEYGWYKGDFFRNWIGDVIKKKTGNANSTFADIEKLKEKKGFRSMFFIGTNLSTRFSEVFSFESTPKVCVADAVRISMSIPLFFAAKRGFRDDVYVDGGVLDNYPVKLFDREKYIIDKPAVRKTGYYDRINRNIAKKERKISPYCYNRETLGFRLDSKEEIAVFRDNAEPVHHKIDSFFDYGMALVSTIIDGQSNVHLHSDDWQRTIYIDTLGVKTTDFNLADKKKKALIQSGRDGVNTYFDWFDNNQAVNKMHFG